MKKTGWIITGIASATAAAATVYVLNKVKKHRLSEQQQHLIHLNDELDAPLTAMESMEDTDDKTIHTIVQDEDDQTIDMPELDPMERNAQIMREVKRMSIDEDQRDQQDPTMDQDDQRIVDELQSVYSHLSRGFIVESIGKCERFAKDFADRAVVTIKYHIAFDTTNDQLAFDQTIKSLGYTSEQGLLEDQMSVKSVITLKYVKLLSDVLTVANQVSACNGHLLGYEVE